MLTCNLTHSHPRPGLFAELFVLRLRPRLVGVRMCPLDLLQPLLGAGSRQLIHRSRFIAATPNPRDSVHDLGRPGADQVTLAIDDDGFVGILLDHLGLKGVLVRQNDLASLGVSPVGHFGEADHHRVRECLAHTLRFAQFRLAAAMAQDSLIFGGSMLCNHGEQTLIMITASPGLPETFSALHTAPDWVSLNRPRHLLAHHIDKLKDDLDPKRSRRWLLKVVREVGLFLGSITPEKRTHLLHHGSARNCLSQRRRAHFCGGNAAAQAPTSARDPEQERLFEALL